MVRKQILYEYIGMIKRDDILRYAKNIGVDLESDELEVIYYYIKTEYRRILADAPSILEEIKGKVREKTYLVLCELYEKYKNKIS